MKKYILFFYIICCTAAYNITTLALFKQINNTYTIHGLWPTFSIEPLEYPSYCSHDKFQVSLLEPIYKNMKTYWYSDQESNVEFWKHEWYKHGTCSGYKFIDYFNQTLNLFYNQTKHFNICNFCKDNCVLNYYKNLTFINSICE